MTSAVSNANKYNSVGLATSKINILFRPAAAFAPESRISWLSVVWVEWCQVPVPVSKMQSESRQLSNPVYCPSTTRIADC
eukprot:scaffold6130_cov152-Skeletonema_marinoi.AAC.5